jgi:uncharacterized protein (DUF1499 family)
MTLSVPAERFVFCTIVAGFVVMPIFSCSGSRPRNLGIKDLRLAPCPSTPNCVSSDAADASHSIAAFQLVFPPSAAWRELRAALQSLPRTQIVTGNDYYIHAECRSAVFGFVDDLELHLRPSENIIAVRSAARLGRSDFGVNRKRVESLRTQLARQGAIR